MENEKIFEEIVNKKHGNDKTAGVTFNGVQYLRMDIVREVVEAFIKEGRVKEK